MKHAILFAAAVALVSCERPDAVAKDAKNVDALPTLNTVQPSPNGAPPAGAKQAVEKRAVVRLMPLAVQGRWGLSPRDCTSGLGDAKGLLVINPTEVRFYESRAIPAADVETTANSISGTFNFAGEGQSWSRYESLAANGNKLVRTERNPLASFNYARC